MKRPSLAFLAAHAPTEIPDWFCHVPPPRPEKPNLEAHPAMQDPDLRMKFHRWASERHDELPPALEPVAMMHDAYAAARQAWRRGNEQARYFQWRRFFAVELDKALRPHFTHED